MLVGGGIKFIFKECFIIGLELGGCKVFIDYLDDVLVICVNYFDVLENNGSLVV